MPEFVINSGGCAGFGDAAMDTGELGLFSGGFDVSTWGVAEWGIAVAGGIFVLGTFARLLIPDKYVKSQYQGAAGRRRRLRAKDE
jgi:hypothetical protein